MVVVMVVWRWVVVWCGGGMVMVRMMVVWW